MFPFSLLNLFLTDQPVRLHQSHTSSAQSLNSILGFERSQHIAISVVYIIIYFADNHQKPLLLLLFKAEFAYGVVCGSTAVHPRPTVRHCAIVRET